MNMEEVEKHIERNVALAPYTTLGIGGEAEYFVKVDSLELLKVTAAWAKKQHLNITVLGGGSNVLISDLGIKGLVIHIELGDVLNKKKGDDLFVTAGAGKDFDALVAELVREGVWGLENLSGVPGSVGAVPIQNVGAYGTEVSDVIASVVAYDTVNHAEVEFSNEACKFAYRSSRFKQKSEKGRYIVTRVTFKLSKKGAPDLSYKDLERYFKGKRAPSLKDVRKAVLAIRSKKFPDWKVIGTAGSFFKNPILSSAQYERLQVKYPDVPAFKLTDGTFKVPLGFVLDKILGLKGHRQGSVGLFEGQALVLVNYGGATASEVDAFADMVIHRVKKETGIEVEREVTSLK